MSKPITTRAIVIERELPYPPEKIWRALTQGPLIEEWLMKNDFEPRVGHRFQLRAQPMPHWNGIMRSAGGGTQRAALLHLELFGRRGREWIENRGHLDPDPNCRWDAAADGA